MDTSGPHMKAHIQSLAKLDKEELAEKLFHTKMALANLADKNVCTFLHCGGLDPEVLHIKCMLWVAGATVIQFPSHKRKVFNCP